MIKQSKTLFARSSLNRHQGQRRWPFRRLFFFYFFYFFFYFFYFFYFFFSDTLLPAVLARCRLSIILPDRSRR